MGGRTIEWESRSSGMWASKRDTGDLADLSIEKDGSIVKPNSRRWHHSLGNALWHTDSSYHQRRSKYSLLLAHGAGPSSGSCTHFADTRAAYADLPDEKKMVLEDLIVEHKCVHNHEPQLTVVFGIRGSLPPHKSTARQRSQSWQPSHQHVTDWYRLPHRARKPCTWPRMRSESLACQRMKASD